LPNVGTNVGDLAPEFELPASDGTKQRLSQYKGEKHVVLATFVASFTGG